MLCCFMADTAETGKEINSKVDNSQTVIIYRYTVDEIVPPHYPCGFKIYSLKIKFYFAGSRIFILFFCFFIQRSHPFSQYTLGAYSVYIIL